MARYVYHVYSFFLLFSISNHSVQSVLPSNQTATMENLYEILKNNTAQSSTFPWNRTEDPNPCSWKGVNCSVNQSSVTQISLPSLSISSPSIVSLLCQIDTLESVDLSNNLLSLIPDEFITDCGELSGLERLNFSRNILSGTLPTFVGFEMLEYLDLSQNLLNGSIGLQLDGLVSLKNLNLGFNKFSGFVPTHFGKSRVLEELDLSANQFQGKFPEEIANYSNLVKIDLSMNSISGSIPDRLQALSKLNIFVLSSNYLSGGIPRFLSSIQSLIRFAVNNNRFSGVIPSGLTMYLRYLDLSYNVLDGFIPDDLLLHPNLLTLDLSNNSLIGSIPEKMSSSLVRLRLGNNLLTGKIPSSFGSLQNLIYLELNDNALTGSIPSELGMCKLLALLNLANNNLTGGLPGQLGNLSNLQELKLQWNNLIGEIPIQITQLQKLQKLNISRNLLNGSISSLVSSLQNLVYLDLSRNNLSGRIPDSIRNLNSLIELQLGMNQLSGNIPLMPQNLQIALNLSSNLFDGSIPKTLSMLGQLEVLDLSNNKLQGEIPESLASIKTLTTLELSNNLLSGVVPAFPSYIMVNTRGNKDLKNDTTVNSPVQRKRVKVVVLSVVAAVVSVAIVTIIAIFAARRYYSTNEQQIKSHEENSPSEIIHGTLLTTNSFHRSNIDFTKAMESVIDPSNVILKTKLSIYYRAIMTSGMSYLVKKLNWADKIFQSGSHNKFQEELQVLGKLSNSNIMSPLAYVLTVDSAYLFYDFAQKDTLFSILHCRKSGEALDWGSRYSIAIGVAQGLAYLHGFSSGPILLLDLSSRNIFLKSLKEPQIGDIEIFKVIDPTKSTGSLSAVAGSVGYIPPEYAYTMRVTMEGNVYSFGVILLELLTGKSAVSQGIELAKWALSNSRQQNNLDGILDFNISHTSLAVRNQMLAVLKVALACVSISTDARPKTKSITRMLLNAR